MEIGDSIHDLTMERFILQELVSLGVESDIAESTHPLGVLPEIWHDWLV